MYTINQMASTGPDIKIAYEDLFAAANMMHADSNHGVEFIAGKKRINFRLLGPATLHVVKTSLRPPNHLVDIIFDSTRVPASFSQAEEIEALALAAARALMLERINSLVLGPGFEPGKP